MTAEINEGSSVWCIVSKYKYLCLKIPFVFKSAYAAGLEVLLRFVFDFGLPWLGFRRSTREGDSAGMDSIYASVLPWFRATGKWQYARLCIDYIWTIHTLHPSIRSTWDKFRTCSLLGNEGRNIAWDQANEFMNLHVKSGYPDGPSIIDAYICMLNGIRSVEENLRAALGEERADPSEYTPLKEHQVTSIVDALAGCLGSTMDELIGAGRKKSSPFGAGPRPWLRVANPGNLAAGSSAADKRAEMVSWVTEQLETNPFPS